MKKQYLLLTFLLAFQSVLAAIPTEEGLLQNLNNQALTGNVVTVKMALKQENRNEYLKFIFLLDRPNIISLVQITYGDSQMQSTQIRDIKVIQDLNSKLAQEKLPERNLFYGTLLMLATNKPSGVEVFLKKNGVEITKNKSLMNEEKMKLLRSYKTYLTQNKSKGEADSPLAPTDPEEKNKVISLFKSNTYTQTKNIELVKDGSDFLWKADWKSVQALFSNEERRLKKITYKNLDNEYTIETRDYTSFNGLNELPKYIEISNEKGAVASFQVISEEVNSKRDLEDIKKKIVPFKDSQAVLSFLY